MTLGQLRNPASKNISFSNPPYTALYVVQPKISRAPEFDKRVKTWA